MHSGAVEKNCDILIQLQKDDYQSGSLIRGYVFLVFNEDYKANQLFLQLTGKEECSWRRNSSVQASARSSSILGSVSHGKREILKLPLVVQTFEEGLVKAGTYQYPFEFQLPEELPNSFSLIKLNVRASIKYKIKASIRASEKNAPRLIRKQIININNKNAGGIAEIGQEFPLSSCWCLNRGVFSLTVRADGDGCFSKGEVANFTLIIDNKRSRLAVNKITCALNFELELHTRMGGEL